MESKVLAIVSGREITENDVNLLLNSLGPQRAQQFQTEDGKKAILDELINQTLFLMDAKDNNLEETEEFKKELELVKENVLKQMGVNNLMKTVQVSVDDAKKYYEENKGQFLAQETANASHILVDNEEKCTEIMNKISNDELTFEDAAKEFSSCPSKASGGNLGTFERGKMVPEFEEVTFNMKVNEISKPVKTQFGYHLIKLNSKSEKSELSFEDSKSNIINDLTKEGQRKVYMDKIAEFRAKYPVEMK